MLCHKCGVEHEGDICPNCGAVVQGKMKCSTCGAIIPDGCVACPRCGSQSAEHFGSKGERVPISWYSAWSVISGLVSLLFSVLLFFDVSIALTESDMAFMYCFSGVVTAILLLFSGVVSVVQHKGKKQTFLLLLVTYGVSSLLCLMLMFAGAYLSGSLLSWWCLICTAVYLIHVLRY